VTPEQASALADGAQAEQAFEQWLVLLPGLDATLAAILEHERAREAARAIFAYGYSAGLERA
jgi:hypothetical protein